MKVEAGRAEEPTDPADEGGSGHREARCRALARALGQRLGEREVTVLLRHSVREPISMASLEAASAAALTDEGRSLARLLGRELPAGAGYRVFASPVPRCVETAELLAAQLGLRGCEAGLEGLRSYLAGDFILDPPVVMQAFARGGTRGFMDAWHGGRLPATAIHEPRRAGAELLAGLLAERAAAGSGRVDLHVAHDLTLVTLLGLATEVVGQGAPWPGYLEGLLLWRQDDSVRIWFRGEVLIVPPESVRA